MKDLIKKIQKLDDADELAIYIEIENLCRGQIVRYIEKVQKIMKEKFPNKRYILLPYETNSQIKISSLEDFMVFFNDNFQNYKVLKQDTLYTCGIN